MEKAERQKSEKVDGENGIDGNVDNYGSVFDSNERDRIDDSTFCSSLAPIAQKIKLKDCTT